MINTKEFEPLPQVEERANTTEVHHKICLTIEDFCRLSVNIPKVCLEVTQHIYGRFDSALYNIHLAENTSEIKEKMQYVSKARTDLFYQYTSIEILVSSHSITPGQAKDVLDKLKEINEDLVKWNNYNFKLLKTENRSNDILALNTKR